MAVWPPSLPQHPLARSYSESGPGMTISTQMEVGEPKNRRRYTAEIKEYNITFTLDSAQVEALDTFYVTTLGGGSLPFDWHKFRDPSTAAEYAFTERPSYRKQGGKYWLASFKLRDVL